MPAVAAAVAVLPQHSALLVVALALVRTGSVVRTEPVAQAVEQLPQLLSCQSCYKLCSSRTEPGLGVLQQQGQQKHDVSPVLPW